MTLRPHEQRILAGVEERLSRNDHALAGLFSRRSGTTVGRTYFRSAALVGRLVVVLVVLVLAYPPATLRGPAAVGLLTAVLVVAGPDQR